MKNQVKHWARLDKDKTYRISCSERGLHPYINMTFEELKDYNPNGDLIPNKEQFRPDLLSHNFKIEIECAKLKLKYMKGDGSLPTKAREEIMQVWSTREARRELKPAETMKSRIAKVSAAAATENVEYTDEDFWQDVKRAKMEKREAKAEAQEGAAGTSSLRAGTEQPEDQWQQWRDSRHASSSGGSQQRSGPTISSAAASSSGQTWDHYVTRPYTTAPWNRGDTVPAHKGSGEGKGQSKGKGKSSKGSWRSTGSGWGAASWAWWSTFGSQWDHSDASEIVLYESPMVESDASMWAVLVLGFLLGVAATLVAMCLVRQKWKAIGARDDDDEDAGWFDPMDDAGTSSLRVQGDVEWQRYMTALEISRACQSNDASLREYQRMVASGAIGAVRNRIRNGMNVHLPDGCFYMTAHGERAHLSQRCPMENLPGRRIRMAREIRVCTVCQNLHRIIDLMDHEE